MGWAGVVIGIIGIIFGFLSYRSSQLLEKKLITEKELIRDKILDIQQIWKGYRDRILNDRKTFNDNMRNQLDISIRIEDIEGNIAVLDRFADRLQKLS